MTVTSQRRTVCLEQRPQPLSLLLAMLGATNNYTKKADFQLSYHFVWVYSTHFYFLKKYIIINFNLFNATLWTLTVTNNILNMFMQLLNRAPQALWVYVTALAGPIQWM